MDSTQSWSSTGFSPKVWQNATSMCNAADKWITEFGNQNNNPESWANSFEQQYGPNGWASEFEQVRFFSMLV